jgi:hypothetical protein
MYTERTASRPPTAKGLADIGVQENEICTRVVITRKERRSIHPQPRRGDPIQPRATPWESKSGRTPKP